MPTFIVLRGPSGSGKSTFANSLAGAFICSADDFFVVDGAYRFDERALAFAHSHCRASFHRAIAARLPLVILDNTNIKAEHFRPYVSAALVAGYEVRIQEFGVPSAEVAAAQNVHRVPLHAIERQMRQWEPCPRELEQYLSKSKEAA